jgi:alkylhydroperoxidase/carboxymuconolactone decarboxylase family protein YurZ
MASKTVRKGKLPKRFLQFQQDYPEVFRAYKSLGASTRAAGPLDSKRRALVGLAIAIGARHEGAVHSHVRKALEAGLKPGEIRHAALLSVTTIGFPNMMAAMSWVDDVLKQ